MRDIRPIWKCKPVDHYGEKTWPEILFPGITKEELEKAAKYPEVQAFLKVQEEWLEDARRTMGVEK